MTPTAQMVPVPTPSYSRRGLTTLAESGRQEQQPGSNQDKDLNFHVLKPDYGTLSSVQSHRADFPLIHALAASGSLRNVQPTLCGQELALPLQGKDVAA